MKKTLGALALLGASAIVLAGCAGAATTAHRTARAKARRSASGSSAPTPRRTRATTSKTTFEDENPGSTLVIEEQTWDGLVDKLTTSLSSSDSPDVVEFGNTQAPAFTSVGALLDISDDVRRRSAATTSSPASSRRARTTASSTPPPLYSGARVVFADPAFVSRGPGHARRLRHQAKDLAAANPGKSGIYFAGQDWYNALPFIWENGGEIAVADGDEWDAQLSSPESVKGLAAGAGPHDQRLAGAQGRRQRRAVDPVLRGFRDPVLGAELGAGPGERVRDGRSARRHRSSTRSRVWTVAPRRSSPAARTSASRRSRRTPTSRRRRSRSS